MKKRLLFLTIILLASIYSTKANNQKHSTLIKIETQKDSTRLGELDRFWAKLAQTVKEGDFEGYKALYHSDAVVVTAAGENQASVPIAKALARWKKGFDNTKTGKQNDQISVRFSQRIGDENTAFETGVFVFTSIDNNSKVEKKYIINFEMLLIKNDEGWYALMEHQKSHASQEDWDALK